MQYNQAQNANWQTFGRFKSLNRKHFLKALLLCAVCGLSVSSNAGTITGNLNKWAPITIEFVGPTASETDTSPNPFLDYRLTVALIAPDGDVHQVPGFFAGDGNGGDNGDRWQVRFAADQVGQWRYQATLQSGSELAISTDFSAGTAVNLEAAAGEFFVAPQSADAPGFLAHGRLEYTGEHYLKFRDGPYWIKSGTDSPENFLGYNGIDGTVDQGGSNFLHDFAAHRGDARGDDPVFSNSSSGADSLGITGALNYLSDQGVNSIYFLPMNLGGDGQETYPFVGGEKNRFNKTHFDISKLYQWNQVLAHAQRRGIALNIQLSETEPENERWLDDGSLGVERKLFFRELIARFGYLLAAKWNLGEENDFPVSELRAQASYLNALDWTKKPISVHTQINNFRDYEQLIGDELFSASSIQYDPPLANEFVETWRKRSADAGRRWVIDMDENTGGITNRNADTRRKQILYDVYFSGGNLEWYYGYHPLPTGGDITAGDFRQREAIWTTMRHARNFMESQLPFWRMQPADQLVSGEADSFGGAEVFAAPGEIYAIYLPNASGNPAIDLNNASGSFSLQWFNPRNGEFEGGTNSIVGGDQVSLGAPPSNSNDDWVVLVKSHNAPDLTDFSPAETSADSVIANDQPSSDTNTNNSDEQATDDSDANTSDEQATNDSDESTSDEPATDDLDTSTTDEQATDDSGEDSSNEPATNESTANTNEQSDDNDRSDSDSSAPDNSETTDAEPNNQSPEFLDVGELPPAEPGELYTLSVTATDAEGVAPIVTAETLPLGMQFGQVADGVATIEWQVPTDATEAVTFELVAIDVQDRSITTTVRITIAVSASTAAAGSEQGNEPESNAMQDAPADNNNADTAQEESTSTMADSTIAAIATSIDFPPIIVGADDAHIRVGQTLRRTVVPVDPEGIVAALRLDSALPGIQFIDNGNGGRELVWTPEEANTGIHELRFIATDSGETPHVIQHIMNLEVHALEDTNVDLEPIDASEDINFAPIFVPIDNQEVRSGDTIRFIVKPLDANGSAPILHVISPPQGARFVDSGDGFRTFIWSVPESFSGELTLQFIATDSDDISVTVEHLVVVTVLP